MSKRLPIIDHIVSNPFRYACGVDLGDERKKQKMNCTSCQRTVLNLSRMPQRQAETILLNSGPLGTCVGYTLDEQGRPMIPVDLEPRVPQHTPWWRQAWMGATLALATACQSRPSQLIQTMGEPQPTFMARTAAKAEDFKERAVAWFRGEAYASKKAIQLMPLGDPAMPSAVPHASIYFQAPEGYRLSLNGHQIGAGEYAYLPLGGNVATVFDGDGKEVLRKVITAGAEDVLTLRLR